MDHTYKCQSCGKTFRLNRPKFCPYCAADAIAINNKARDSALSMIEEHDKLMKDMLIKFDEYAKIFARVEYIRSTLRTYKSRGIIQESEMPDFTKPKLLDYVKKYREQVKNDRI